MKLFTVFFLLFSYFIGLDYVAAQTPEVPTVSAQGAEQTQPLVPGQVDPTEYLDIVIKFTDVFVFYGSAFAGLIFVCLTAVSLIIGKSSKDISASLQEDAQRFRNETTNMLKNEQASIQNEQVSIRRELAEFKDSLPLLVERAAKATDNTLKPVIRDMLATYEKFNTEIKNYESALVATKHLTAGEYDSDPEMNKAFADYVSRLPEDPNNSEYLTNRNQARARLGGTIRAAEAGNVDSNLLFNSAMVASRLDMDDLALKLMTYASYFSPTTSHSIALYRLQMTLGRAYAEPEQKETVSEIGTKSYTYPLSVINKAPKDIEEEAFTSALTAAANAPLPQNEIIYAELWNMAQKTRETGGYERMRDVLLACYHARLGQTVTAANFERDIDKSAMMRDPTLWKSQEGQKVPSNLLGKISATFALIGTPGWEDQYKHYLSLGMEIAAKESEMTTWRKPFIRDALDNAGHLGKRAQVNDQMKKIGLISEAMENDMNILNQLRSGKLSELLKAVAEN